MKVVTKLNTGRVKPIILTISLCLFLISFFTQNSIFAQQTTGNIRGVISDPSGAAIANAKITILDPKTNTRANTQSSNSGEYEFKNLPVGDYKITIEAAGFKSLNLTDVRVQLNQTTDVPASVAVISRCLSRRSRAGGHNHQFVERF